MKQLFSILFRWNPTKEIIIPFVSGFSVIGLSLLMIPASSSVLLQLIIRDIVMIFLIGIFFPVLHIQRSDSHFREFGLTLERWYIFLPINLILGILLLLMFLSENPPPMDFVFDSSSITKILYIMLAGVFEVVFFYAFLRTLFERAFGILPAIILTALFYAFHHAGFQAEFGKLIFVGILYAAVFRFGKSALLIYPFFWGVGGCYDVLIQSQVVSQIIYPGIRCLYLSVLVVFFLVWTFRKTQSKQFVTHDA